MQSPLIIQPPIHSSEAPQVIQGYPLECAHKLRFATPQLIIGDSGEFLLQTIKGEGYWIEYWSFINKKAGSLNIEVIQPFDGMAIMLEGHGEITEMKKEWLNLSPKSFSIFYAAEGIHKCHLEPGAYEFIYFIPPAAHWPSLEVDFPAIKNKMERLHKSGDAFLNSLPLPINIIKMLKRLSIAPKTGVPLDLDLRKYMFDIMRYYFEKLNISTLQELPTLENKVLDLQKYIKDNLQDPSLGGAQQLAPRFYMTTRTLFNVFKVITGKTIAQYIREERLAMAKLFLENTNDTVADITLKVGFTDTSNFIKVFKKKFGYSPGSLRSKHAK